MKKTIFISFVMLTSLSAAAQNYELVWKDEFRGRGPDWTHWSKITRGQVDWRRYMSSDESLFDVRGGKLVLRAVENDGICPDDTASFLTGGLYTKGKFTVTYGKVEVRARLQCGRSVWPAIWMLPHSGSWPDAGEIDIMEHLNHDDFVYQTLHSAYTKTIGRVAGPPHSVIARFNPQRYNVFGVEILPDRIVFSVNGKETMTYPKLSPEECGSDMQYPFGTPFYLLVDMQIGGSWVGPPDPSDLPVEMHVDWVKVYSLEQ